MLFFTQPLVCGQRPGQLRGAGRCADWRADITVLEDEALIGQSVQVRCLDPVVPVRRHSVGTLLIGKDVEQVVRLGHVDLRERSG